MSLIEIDYYRHWGKRLVEHTRNEFEKLQIGPIVPTPYEVSLSNMGLAMFRRKMELEAHFRCFDFCI